MSDLSICVCVVYLEESCKEMPRNSADLRKPSTGQLSETLTRSCNRGKIALKDIIETDHKITIF